jgi:hypothetical protein
VYKTVYIVLWEVISTHPNNESTAVTTIPTPQTLDRIARLGDIILALEDYIVRFDSIIMALEDYIVRFDNIILALGDYIVRFDNIILALGIILSDPTI